MKKVEIRDLLEFTIPSNLQYSDTGEYLAFETAETDGNGYKHAVWVVKNNQAVRMTYTEDTTLIGWKDEHTLAVKRIARDHKAGCMDVWYLDVNGAEAQYAGSLPLELRGFQKTAEGYAAVGTIKRTDPDAYLDSQEVRAQKAEKAAAEKDYEVLDELPYWFNGRNFTNGNRTALFTVKGTSVKRVTSADTDVSCFTVLGNIIYFTGEEWKGIKKHSENLYAYDLNTETVRCVCEKEGMTWNSPFVMNGCAYIFATDHVPYGTNQTPDLYRIAENGIEKVLDASLSLRNTVGSDTAMGMSKGACVDGSAYITLATEEDHTVIRKYDDAFGYEVLYEAEGCINGIDAYDGKTAFIMETEDRLFEVYERDQDGSVRKVTALNDAVLQDKYIAVPERIDYESKGLSLHGWVLKPMDYTEDRKYPAVLDIHGGPRSVYGTNYFHEMQVWASQGYFVFFTNIKGSDGRGDEFADLRDRYGYIDYDNLMDFTDAVLQAYPAIDEEKVCVTGGSYGGYMVNWMIGHTDRFCCAASQRSISNYVSKCLISDIGYRFDVEEQGASDILDGIDKLWEHSPLAYAKNAVTPTLFIHSDEDRRCPLPEAMQMMQALMVQGVETRMCLFHGENHELSRSGKPLHRIRRLQEMTDWFNAHTA